MTTTPILEHSVNLRQKKIGLPTSVTAKLFSDKIEIIDKNGGLILSAPLASLEDIRDLRGAITFVYNGQYYSLEFFKMLSKMFGLLGMLLDGGIKKSKLWREAMQSKGITVEKRWM